MAIEASCDDHYSDYIKVLTKGIADMYHDESTADIQVVVDDKTFNCHKSILISVSPYFRAMFTSGMQECKSKKITLKEISPKIFSSVLEYIYKGAKVADKDNCEELLHVAYMYQMDCLQELASHELIVNLNYQNCMRLWKIGKVYRCQSLIIASYPLVCNSFGNTCLDEDFMVLDSADVVEIIQNEKLFVPDEEMVCDSVLAWLDYSFGERRNDFQKVLQHVRLATCSPEYLLGTLEKHEIMKLSTECRELFNEARDFHMLPARQQEFGSCRTYHRLDGDLEDVLVVITDYNPYRSTTYPCNKTIACFSFISQKWIHLANLPYDPGLDFAMVTHSNDVYITGGHMKHRCTLKFEFYRNECVECSNMRRGRYSHCMVASKQSLYVLGGYSQTMPDGAHVLSTIEEYNINGKKWKNVGELKCGVESTSAAVFDEKIYVYGGITKDNSATAIVQYFDTRNKESSIVSELPVPTKLTRTVVIDRNVYLITLEGIMMMPHHQDNESNLRVVMDTSYFAVIGAIHYRGSIIFLMGTGTKDPMSLCHVIQYDFKTCSTKQLSTSTGDSPKLIYGSTRTVLLKENLVNPY